VNSEGEEKIFMAIKRKSQTVKQVVNKLSASDRLILDSYTITMEGLASFFGEAFEFVLHDITDLNHSMLEKIQANDTSKPFMCYTSKSKYGRPVKSASIVIFGDRKKVIGLLCVNFYLDSPLTALLQNFSLDPRTDYVTENFSSDSDELIARALEKAKSEVASDDSVPSHFKNKEIVTILYHQGIFKLKNAVQDISGELGISKSTVYLHIRALEEKSY